MNKTIIRSIVVIAIAILVSFFIVKMNEPFVLELQGYSLYLWAAVIAFMINWIAFIPSYIFQTEHYYDITGTVTYFGILVFLFLSADVTSNSRGLILIILPAIWTLRLGSFLFTRIQKSGKDTRFDHIKPNFFRFLTAWTLQALWVFLTLSAVIAVVASTLQYRLDIFALIGGLVWLVGFGIEAVSYTHLTLPTKA